ncbi:hypothetical protein GLOIN_2v1876583 [Rhizophagus irregularis DAOM 181602=DAOM 197198]|uniref:Myb-like domain-containing protein n=1 Tax=Rhizophagus irregularis (strain DAOM 197198w) TaxID=1432141 RepID=A0A015JGK4_RHIIW|nr:hypothetical protein RirG_125880 [Rhizophagus irregularis DAOM 197198w]GBC27951.2 hypothetical protein GLOIN_2v1876583 [Rhizophagus irregularis DAOM 181602=DAOM 197198]
MWTDDEVRMLIDERKEGNAHYHSLGGGNCKRAWWISTAGKINQRFKTVYTGRQASEKFHGIVKDCRSMELSIIKDLRGKITRNGERYYLEFRNKIAIPTVTNTIATATVTNTTTATAAGSESAVSGSGSGSESGSRSGSKKIT